MPGEDLLYEVSFLGIKLGAVRVVTEGSQQYNSKDVIKAKCYMDSYRGIPFISLHSTYDSWIDPSSAYSYKFEGNTKQSEGNWAYEKIIFNYDEGKINFENWINKKLNDKNEFRTKKKMNDGLSLFFTARQFLKSNKSIRIPTFMGGDTSYTNINFTGKIENVEIDAVDYPVRTVYFNGKADWTGVYGVTGQFEGWFSDDEAKVPILAKMKLYIGSADIKLIKWKRNGWQPPRD